MLETSRPTVARPEYSSEFSVQRQNAPFANTSEKLLHRKGCGQRSVESACRSVISAVNKMKTNGARNSAAIAINRL
jgi:hypothetical protein